jgi:hypothetical protein
MSGSRRPEVSAMIEYLPKSPHARHFGHQVYQRSASYQPAPCLREARNRTVGHLCAFTLAQGPTATVVLTLTTTQALSAAATGIASPGPEYLFLTFLASLIFATIHLLGREMAFLRATPRNVWLSAAGGISIAYVFVHILPELAHHQDVFATHAGRLSFLDTSERDVYLAALAGLTALYGLELWARSSARRRARRDGVRRPSSRIFLVTTRLLRYLQ